MQVSYIGTDTIACNYGCRFDTSTSKVFTYLCGATCFCATYVQSVHKNFEFRHIL